MANVNKICNVCHNSSGNLPILRTDHLPSISMADAQATSSQNDKHDLSSTIDPNPIAALVIHETTTTCNKTFADLLRKTPTTKHRKDKERTNAEPAMDMTQTKFVTDLPMEVLAQIARHLGPKAIKNTVLVCRAFHQGFQQELYKRIYWNFGTSNQTWLDDYARTNNGHLFDLALQDKKMFIAPKSVT